MNSIIRHTAAILLVLTVFSAASFAQQRRQTAPPPRPKTPVAPLAPPTFDTLIPAGSYMVYIEIRGAGQLIRSNALNELLEPVLKLAGPPKEFGSMVSWLNDHADEIMTSRLLVTVWPVVKDLPSGIIAIEFASAEEAAKFAKPLNEILGTVVPDSVVSLSPDAASNKTTAVMGPGFQLQQAGNLIIFTLSPLELDTFRRTNRKILSDDNNFRIARNRFNSEAVFVYFDVDIMERQEEESRKRYQEAQRAAAEEAKKRRESDPDNFGLTEVTSDKITGNVTIIESPPGPQPETDRPPPDPFSIAMEGLSNSLVSIEPDLPSAVAVALSFENDSFDARVLLVNQAGKRSDAWPFLPMLTTGPPLLYESHNILPADTELFITVSLDLPQIHARLSRPPANRFTDTGSGPIPALNSPSLQSPFAGFEKLLKIKISEDILPLLGSEVALGLPFNDIGGLGVPGIGMFGMPRTQKADDETAATPAPIILLSLKDKEGMRSLMPKLVESVGFKGAGMFAHTERRDNTELVSYANVFAYAFIGNFLVLSTDAATTRRVVDSYLKGETLASDSTFRSYTRWQPRPSQAQLYLSPALMQSIKDSIEQTEMRIGGQAGPLFTQLSAVAQPITYSLSNEGFGPFHELHLPKSLVLMGIAAFAGAINPPEEVRNERMAVALLYTIAYAEDRHKTSKGSYGTLEQLIDGEMLSKEMIVRSGYKIEVFASGDKFEVTAVPLEYGKTGKMSFYLDETKVIRGADRNGAAANRSDPQVY